MEIYTHDSAVERYFDEHSRQLDDLRRKGLLCDVELCCEIKEDGLTFPIHRAVMAGCSPYFRALFTYTQPSDRKTVIKIPGISDRILKEIVEFAYTGKVQVDEQNVESLLSAADMLHVMGVLKACSEFLVENLSVENCIGIYKFASFYNSTKLASTAKNYILVNFVDVAQASTEFLYLQAVELKEICTDDELNVRQEEDVASSILRWVAFDSPSRSQHLCGLLSCIRYGYMSMECFLQNITNNHLTKREDCQSILKGAWELIQVIQNEGLSFIDTGNPYVRPRVPNDILFVVGGWSSHGTTISVETYDTRSDRWYRLEQSLPTPRAYHGVVTLKDRIYVIGGYDGIKYHNGMQYFDCVEQVWCESAPMYVPRCYVTVVSMDGLIFACGGYDGRHRQNSAERYDPSANQWLMIAPMGTKRSDASGCTLDGKLYVVGGFDGHSCLETAEIYTPVTDQWTTIESMSKRRSGLGVLTYRGEIYAAGGYDGTDRLESVEKYSSSSESWSLVTEMSVGRSNFAFQIIDDMMFIIGGYDGNSITPLVECYDVRTQTWYDANCLNVSRSATRAGVISNLPNKKAFSFYGQTESKTRLL